MAIITNLQIQCQKGKLGEFVEMAKQVLPDTWAYDGCHRYDICINPKDEDKGLLFLAFTKTSVPPK